MVTFRIYEVCGSPTKHTFNFLLFLNQLYRKSSNLSMFMYVSVSHFSIVSDTKSQTSFILSALVNSPSIRIMVKSKQIEVCHFFSFLVRDNLLYSCLCTNCRNLCIVKRPGMFMITIVKEDIHFVPNCIYKCFLGNFN